MTTDKKMFALLGEISERWVTEAEAERVKTYFSRRQYAMRQKVIAVAACFAAVALMFPLAFGTMIAETTKSADDGCVNTSGEESTSAGIGLTQPDDLTVDGAGAVFEFPFSSFGGAFTGSVWFPAYNFMAGEPITLPIHIRRQENIPAGTLTVGWQYSGHEEKENLIFSQNFAGEKIERDVTIALTDLADTDSLEFIIRYYPTDTGALSDDLSSALEADGSLMLARVKAAVTVSDDIVHFSFPQAEKVN